MVGRRSETFGGSVITAWNLIGTDKLGVLRIAVLRRTEAFEEAQIGIST